MVLPQTLKRQRDLEQGLRLKAEARAESFERRFDDERAERLKGLHQFNKEEVREWAVMWWFFCSLFQGAYIAVRDPFSLSSGHTATINLLGC